jgi:hypothetical protein
MPDDPDEREQSRAYVWLLGTGALGAWFVLLWLMFGDVL